MSSVAWWELVCSMMKRPGARKSVKTPRQASKWSVVTGELRPTEHQHPMPGLHQLVRKPARLALPERRTMPTHESHSFPSHGLLGDTSGIGNRPLVRRLWRALHSPSNPGEAYDRKVKKCTELRTIAPNTWRTRYPLRQPSLRAQREGLPFPSWGSSAHVSASQLRGKVFPFRAQTATVFHRIS